MADDDRDTMVDVIRLIEGRHGLDCALAEAARWDLPSEAERLVRAGAQVDGRVAPHNATPLMYANTPRIAKFLVEHGADPNAQCDDGATPLLSFLRGMCTRRQAERYIETLLELGADPTIPSNDGETAVELARAKYGDGVAAILENHVPD